jgi:hypothetical protein
MEGLSGSRNIPMNTLMYLGVPKKKGKEFLGQLSNISQGSSYLE